MKFGVTALVALALIASICVPIAVQALDGPPGGSVWQVRPGTTRPLVFYTAHTTANSLTWDIGSPARITFPNGNPAQVTNGRVRGRITGETLNVSVNNQNRWITTWAIINLTNHVGGQAW